MCLYWFGERGYSEIYDGKDKGKGLTLLQYLQRLTLQDPRFRYSGSVVGQWLVDMWIRLEDDRINYAIKSHKE